MTPSLLASAPAPAALGGPAVLPPPGERRAGQPLYAGLAASLQRLIDQDTLFSVKDRYRNCLRLNCAIPWTAEIDAALRTLGDLAKMQL